MKANKQLVFAKNNTALTDSLAIAEGVGLEHRTVIRLIRKYESDFNQLGTLNFESSKSGGLPTEYAILNEDQATYLVTLFRNSDIVRAFKLQLVKEFRKAINEIQRLREQRLNVDWQEARSNSKCIRTALNKSIQALSDLADKQGGTKNRQYYSSVTKMIYKELFGDSSLKDVRNKLDIMQMTFLTVCEQAIAQEVEKLVELEIDYHDIYQEAKRLLINTVNALSMTRLESKNSTVVKLAWETKPE
jgi:phage regulator Rha-like protein